VRERCKELWKESEKCLKLLGGKRLRGSFACTKFSLMRWSRGGPRIGKMGREEKGATLSLFFSLFIWGLSLWTLFCQVHFSCKNYSESALVFRLAGKDLWGSFLLPSDKVGREKVAPLNPFFSRERKIGEWCLQDGNCQLQTKEKKLKCVPLVYSFSFWTFLKKKGKAFLEENSRARFVLSTWSSWLFGACSQRKGKPSLGACFINGHVTRPGYSRTHTEDAWQGLS